MPFTDKLNVHTKVNIDIGGTDTTPEKELEKKLKKLLKMLKGSGDGGEKFEDGGSVSAQTPKVVIINNTNSKQQYLH